MKFSSIECKTAWIVKYGRENDEMARIVKWDRDNDEEMWAMAIWHEFPRARAVWSIGMVKISKSTDEPTNFAWCDTLLFSGSTTRLSQFCCCNPRSAQSIHCYNDRIKKNQQVIFFYVFLFSATSPKFINILSFSQS